MERPIAHYLVFELLGAGGMGAVHRARDTRLQRDLALKLLPPPRFADASARERFLREARAAAALNHPGICTVYEVGEANGEIYIAMELIPGRTLGELIPAGGMATETVLVYGAQIADALAHAHEHGVIHRDLKSANVMITPEGRAKVLDFGVARRMSGADADAGPGAHLALTQTGTVVGTPQYLAPEVLRGAAADERSDVWALGVLLYEMASGALPFAGRTGHELSAAILREPPVRLPSRVPPGLRALIQRCLAKEPAQRFGRAGEVRAALEALRHDSGAPGRDHTARRRGWALGAGIALALLALVGTAAWLAREQPWKPRELKQRQLTSNTPGDLVLCGAISPDGKTVAVLDRAGLALRSTDSGEGHRLALPAGFSLWTGGALPLVDWYPDGNQLLVSGTMDDGSPCAWAIPVLGGRAHKVIPDGTFATIARDGSRIAYLRPGKLGADIWCTDANGQNPFPIVSSDSSGVITTWAVWSPSSRRLVYERARDEQGWLESCDLEGHRRRVFAANSRQRLHEITVPAWLADGQMVFGLTEPPPDQGDVNLWSLRVDPRSGVPAGSPRRVTQWQRLSLLLPTASSTPGKELVVNAIEYQSDCYVGRFAEGDSGLQDVSRLTLDDRMDLGPTWLPDGKAILFTSDRDGSPDVFRQSLESSEAEPLITGPGTQRNARVSPDGAWILYEDFPIASAKSAAAAPRLMRMPIGGGPSERVLAMQPTSTYRCARSPASLCVMSEVNDASMVFTAFDPVRGRGREVSRQAVGVAATTPPPWDLSPDGSALAVVVSQDTLPHLRLLSLRNAPPRDIRLDRKVAIQDIAWAADGKSWLAVAWVGKGEWNLLRIAPDGRTHAMIPSQLWMYEVAPAADGRHVAYTSNTGQGNLWLLEGI